MVFGLSLLLITGGAVLIWGITGAASGVDLDAIGVILMVAGILSTVLSLLLWASWLPWVAHEEDPRHHHRPPLP